MSALKFTSCMAANADSFCQLLTDYMGAKLKQPTEFVGNLPWQEREQQFEAGAIQVCWICGLPYVWQADRPDAELELLAAPVMQGERYGNRPVYFSDVVVQRSSPFHCLDDLRGATWAYNEPRSHSGYYVTRYTLTQRGKGSSYFRQVVASGAHQASLQLILSGKVDASAIDSTVLALELQSQPGLAEQIRVIDTFGPSPIPPWVISTRVADSLRQSLRLQFGQMHRDPVGKAILHSYLIERFTHVVNQDYDPIRQMIAQAEAVCL